MEIQEFIDKFDKITPLVNDSSDLTDLCDILSISFESKYKVIDCL